MGALLGLRQSSAPGDTWEGSSSAPQTCPPCAIPYVPRVPQSPLRDMGVTGVTVNKASGREPQFQDKETSPPSGSSGSKGETQALLGSGGGWAHSLSHLSAPPHSLPGKGRLSVRLGLPE